MNYSSVARRASRKCEYCLAPEYMSSVRFVVEHVLAKVAGGTDDPENVALACYGCNSFKGETAAGRDPISGTESRLFNPRTDNWTDHFVLDTPTCQITGLTDIGRATVSKLRFNRLRQVRSRKHRVQWGWPEKSRP